MRVQTPQNPALTQKLKTEQESLSKPPWLKIRPLDPTKFALIKSLLREKKLNTVCEEAHCPNMSECWSGDGEKGGKGGKGGTATFMLMGDTCTRACRFCYVKSGNPKGILDEKESEHLVEAVKIMGLDYIVLTCVTRDDLPDGGAAHFAKCVQALKAAHPKILVEVLISDLDGNKEALQTILASGADVIAHNLETVKRLQGQVRDPRANYQKSLAVLENAKKLSMHKKFLPGQTAHPPSAADPIYTKSSLMLGLGETEEEVIQSMRDLRAIDVDVVTFGQYLRPSPFHLAVQEFVTPEKFKHYENLAKNHGFIYCASGPFVRSSYRAGELFLKNIIQERRS